MQRQSLLLRTRLASLISQHEICDLASREYSSFATTSASNSDERSQHFRAPSLEDLLRGRGQKSDGKVIASQKPHSRMSSLHSTPKPRPLSEIARTASPQKERSRPPFGLRRVDNGQAPTGTCNEPSFGATAHIVDPSEDRRKRLSKSLQSRGRSQGFDTHSRPSLDHGPSPPFGLKRSARIPHSYPGASVGTSSQFIDNHVRLCLFMASDSTAHIPITASTI